MPTRGNNNRQAMSVDYATYIADYLSERGHDRAQLLTDAGIPQSQLDDHLSFITLAQYTRLLEAARQITRDPQLGLLIGKSIEMGSHGILAFSALAQPTYWKLVEGSLKFSRVRNRIIDMQCVEGESFNSLEFDTIHFTGDLYRIVIEIVATIFCETAKYILEDNQPGLELFFRFGEPAYSDQYEALLGVKCHFEAQKNELRVSKAFANTPLKLADPRLAAEFDRQCDLYLKEVEDDESLADKVRSSLFMMRGDFPSHEEMAVHFNMSPRSFRRHLKEEGTSFHALRDEVRIELAKHYLESTHWRISEIAHLIGYQDASSFSYAFKKHQGISPQSYRRDIDGISGR